MHPFNTVSNIRFLLCVDGDPGVLEAVERTLGPRGFVVRSVLLEELMAPEEAFKRIYEQGPPSTWALAFLGARLGRSGPSIGTKLRAIRGDLAILVLAPPPNAHHRPTNPGWWPDGVVPNPFQPEDLIAAVDRVIGLEPLRAARARYVQSDGSSVSQATQIRPPRSARAAPDAAGPRQPRANSWSSLSPADFEEMMYWLLTKEGFFNVSWHGLSGSDKGRDIVCQRTELFGPRVVTTTCVVQCKRYSGAVSTTVLHDDIVKVMEHNPDYLIIATSGILSSRAKDWLGAFEKQIPFGILLWEKTDLEQLLDHHQHLRYEFLGVPFEYRYVIGELGRAIFRGAYTSEEQLVLGPLVRGVLMRACEAAMIEATLLTIGHVLVQFLAEEGSITSNLVDWTRTDRTAVSAALAYQLPLQVKIPIPGMGLRMTDSLRLALDIALQTKASLQETTLSERALLRGIFAQTNSETIAVFAQMLGIADGELMGWLLTKAFKAHEFDRVRDVAPVSAKSYHYAGGQAEVANLVAKAIASRMQR